MARITLAVISAQLENLTGLLREHIENDKEQFEQLQHLINGNGTPGMKTRLDRLEQSEDNRKYHIRTIWSAFAAAVIAWGFSLWYGLK